MDSKYEIVRYCDEFAERWDTFLETIVNGTFLQSRRFLSYHPVGRFKDCSLIIYDQKKNLVGLCPAVVQMESGRRHFVSHPGSTFGGLIVSSKNYRATKLIEMLKSMECFLRENDFHDVDLHITPTIFSQESDALMEYVLNYLGYQESVELNTYIDYDDYMIPVEKNFTQGKRSEVHKSQRQHLYGRRIQNLDELTTFYGILCENLKKYQAKPVHTISELRDFAENRLKEECEFFGIFLSDGEQEKLIAGGMLFYFATVNTAHTQYLAASSKYHAYDPMTFLYYYIIKTMQERGFKKLSFGISTEQRGAFLNEGLIRSKEAYGSKHSVNRKFWKEL